MFRNLGCFLFDVVSDQEKEILSIFNDLLDKNPHINGSLFTSNYQNSINKLKRFSIFSSYEANYYYGDMFVWDIISLDIVRNFPNINRIFYFQEASLPWPTNAHMEYSMWEKLFCNKKTTIITNLPEVKEVYDLVWSGKCELLKTMNAESLYEAIR